MKILCFGDSNTFGFNPENFKRYSENERWSGILKKYFSNIVILEEGCNNRTCFSNAQKELNSIKIIEKHLTQNIDLVILQIGINDLQMQFNTELSQLKEKLIELIEKIKSKNIKILLLCPNEISENILNSYFNKLFDKNSIKKSKLLYSAYQDIAKTTKINVLFLSDITKTSTIDGLHYDIENHRKIADVLIKYIKENYSNNPNSTPCI